MNLSQLFLRPELWPILLSVPLAFLIFYLVDRNRARRLAQTVGTRPQVGPYALHQGRRLLRRRLSLAGLFLALLALLQPAWGEGFRRVGQRGVDILVCLDVSRSMLARDQSPSRLQSAHREIRALAERVKSDRLGLVAFAGTAKLIVPLTQDRRSFAEMAGQTDTLSVDRGGTDLGAALEMALQALTGKKGEHQTILLLTDGEDLEQRGLALAKRCQERGIKIHCLGFGSPQGSKITIVEGEGETFLRDRNGAEVVSAMDPASLGRIAKATGGEFIQAMALPVPLIELYEKRILPMARKSFAIEARRERQNRFQWPLLAAFFLWILGLCITERKNS